MSITKVYIPDYELDYLESKPKSTAAAYSRQEIIWEDPNCLHEFVDLTAIWHDASKEPKRGELILCLDRNDGVFTGAYYVSRIDEYNRYYPNSVWSYEDFLCYWDYIKRWAYLNDFLLKGGK